MFSNNLRNNELEFTPTFGTQLGRNKYEKSENNGDETNSLSRLDRQI